MIRPFCQTWLLKEVERANHFGVGLGLAMENALIAILIDFAVFQIKINSKSSVLFHDDEVSVIDGGAALAEKEAAGGDAILMVAMAVCHNAEALLIFHVGEARDKDIALAVARDRMLVPEFLNFGYQNQSLLSDT